MGSFSLIHHASKESKEMLNLIWLGIIHILGNHIFRIFGPPSPLRKHAFSTENNQKLAFSDPPPPLQVIT